MCLSLIVLFLRQEKYCIPGILSSCSREGNSKIQSWAMLPVTAISPQLLQMTPMKNTRQCKCETKHEKERGQKKKGKKWERKKGRTKWEKKKEIKKKKKSLQASDFNLFGFFHYLFACFFPPLIIPLQSSQTCRTSTLVAQEQNWALMLCSGCV